MKMVGELTVLVLLCAVCAGCSHQANGTSGPEAVHNDAVKVTSTQKLSCRNKPNFEGMLRTLCY